MEKQETIPQIIKGNRAKWAEAPRDVHEDVRHLAQLHLAGILR